MAAPGVCAHNGNQARVSFYGTSPPPSWPCTSGRRNTGRQQRRIARAGRAAASASGGLLVGYLAAGGRLWRP